MIRKTITTARLWRRLIAALLPCALLVLACRSPLSVGRVGDGEARLSISVRAPYAPGIRGGAASPRVLLSTTASVRAVLTAEAGIALERSAERDAEGFFRLAFDAIESGRYSLVVEASDDQGVYARAERALSVAEGDNPVTLSLLPTAAASLSSGRNAPRTVEPNRSVLFGFTAPYAGDWTVGLPGPVAVSAWGSDGAPLAGFYGGQAPLFAGLSAGDTVYLAATAGIAQETVAPWAYRSLAGSANVAFGNAGATVLSGPIVAASEAVADMALLPDGRVALAGNIVNGTDRGGFVAIASTDGNLDASFGGDGWVGLDIYDDMVVTACAVQSTAGSERILVCGYYLRAPLKTHRKIC